MNLLLKNVTVIDASSPYHLKTVDVRLSNGTIKEIGNSLESVAKEKIIERDNLHISQGWFDASVSVGEPGYEERETIENALQVAAHSGFTRMAINPNTYPITDSSGGISYLLKRSENHPTQIIPIGALSQNSNSIDLAELYDMQQAGAIAFGDYQKPIENPNLLKIALEYTQGFDGLVLSFPQENKIAGKGSVNEGIPSTRLGLRGIPTIAESLQVARDLHILAYTGGRLHIPTISTKESLELIKEAKKKGLSVSCGVSIMNLFFTDEVLEDFDTNFKVLPPLRSSKDQKALLKGIKDGIIDLVTSDHNPLDQEHKMVEFDNAMYGAVTQQSVFSALCTLIPLEKTVEMLTKGTTVFGINSHSIAAGNTANMTLFNPEGTHVFDEGQLLSKSKNAPFVGRKLIGTVYGIISAKKMVLH